MDRNGLQDLLYRIGYAAERLGGLAGSASSRVMDAAGDLADDAEDALDEADQDDATAGFADVLDEHAPEALGMAGTFAAGWIAKRFLAPRDVNWPRAILAGMVGSLLFDLEMMIDQRVTGRKTDTAASVGAALTDDPHAQEWLGRVGRYAAGIGLASVYARYLYGRLPGPPVAQGITFGALDAATLSYGGLLPMLNRISPEVRLPLGYAGLSCSPEISAQVMLRHLAYGAGVGAVYRD